ncbi:hypothetical protein JTB14_029851 [Gonioctena quinquepunctata]|nr:hypothetical protein JTB14_029851 [Gonioctena quinquepunctata]
MEETNSWLIGDSGYHLQAFLMTPINDIEPHAVAVRYNQAHASARNGVERTIGLCKMRFRRLLKRRANAPLPENELEAIRNIPLVDYNTHLSNQVQQTRNNIVRRYFTKYIN